MSSLPIRFGAHIFLWIERWSSQHIGLFERVKALGLDCLEIAVGDEVDFNPSQIRQGSEALGLEIIASPGGVWPLEADIAHPDLQRRQFGLGWHKAWIDRIAAAKATAYTGALYSHPGRVERRPPSEAELAIAAENLHVLAEYAARSGVTLALEPMSRFRTHLVNTPQQAMDLVQQADHPNLKVLFDTYHAVTEVRDYAAGLHTLAGRLWGLHACENDRGVPGGGLVPWEAVFGALREIHFSGHILLESYNTSLKDFSSSRGLFQNVCPDGDEFVRSGLKFLQSSL
jgi:D-psicose/D-tagatose/L-ribulose 3-epimerase